MNISIVHHSVGGRKWLFRDAATAATLVAPMFIGLMDAPDLRAQAETGARSKFEVASVKPSKPEEVSQCGARIQLTSEVFDLKPTRAGVA